MSKTYSRPHPSILYVTATVLLGCFVLLYLLSNIFPQDNSAADQPVLLFVSLLIFSSVPYLTAVSKVKKREVKYYSILFIFILGIVIRLITIFSSPVLEVDFFRYMWDGAVTSEGITPYRYSPMEVISGDTGNAEIEKLAEESEDVIKEINHKHLKTIYPPVTQMFFAVSHIINPWSLLTWKFVLLITDIINFFLLLMIMKQLNIPWSNMLIYWWNPLLIVTTFNAAHFDIITVTFVMISLLLILKGRVTTSLVTLGLGIGVKLWPVFIAPLMIRPYLRKKSDLLKNFLILLLPVLVIFTPVFLSTINSSSGFVAYGISWENNSSAFRIFLFVFETIFGYTGIHPGHAQKYSRIFVMLILSLSVIYLFFRRTGRQHLISNLLIMVALLFLLIPTQFPWYYTWLVPFLAIRPVTSLLLLTSFLPLYYTFYYLDALGAPEIFSNVIIWIEFVPVWLMILYEWLGRKEIYH